MKISLNEIKKYTPIPEEISDRELVELIGSRLVEVEEVIDLAPAYKNIYIVKVVKAEPIAGTHLNLCEIDAGDHNRDFSQLEDGLVQVVCGAPNVHAGMLAVWIAPGAIVPETYGEENFKISTRKLRGHESNGMLAGADELGFSNEHKEIAEIDPKIAKPGDSFAEIFELNDIILDVENKSLTHRPDCFGLIGFAREVAGILGQKFVEPSVFQTLGQTPTVSNKLEPKVVIEDAKLCPRYSCAVFDLPDNEPSKFLTKEAVFLAKAGMRAIDPMVDLTNILMLETGQPLHAFDYDKLVAVGEKSEAKIVVRAAEDGEQLQLLDGKTIECVPEDILITSNGAPVALAGAMGGKNTEIDPSTKRVVLESATFSLYHLRKTQMAHGIFSEAITRFTKGQPASQTLAVLEAALQRLGVDPLAVVDQYPDREQLVKLNLSTQQINDLLGTEYSSSLIKTTLENVGFEVKILEELDSKAISSPVGELDPQSAVSPQSSPEAAKNAKLEVIAPLWRTDIRIPEDVIEEVGRLLGYDNIRLDLPQRPFLEAQIDPMIELKAKIREIFSDKLGMCEVLTYSFVSERLLWQVGQDAEQSYKIVNSISPDLQRFRQQITPSLLAKIPQNLKAGHRDFMLYEMNQVTSKDSGLTDEGVPQLEHHLGVVALSDFYTLKAYVLSGLQRDLHVDLKYVMLTSDQAVAQKYPYFEPIRSVAILLGDQIAGVMGEVRKSVCKKFKLDMVVSALEIDLTALLHAPKTQVHQVDFSKYPPVERDLTLKVAADAPFGRFYECVMQALSQKQLICEVTPLSIYQSDPNDSTKNLSFHLRFSDTTKTLTTEEISAIMNRITKQVGLVGAEVV